MLTVVFPCSDCTCRVHVSFPESLLLEYATRIRYAFIKLSLPKQEIVPEVSASAHIPVRKECL